LPGVSLRERLSRVGAYSTDRICSCRWHESEPMNISDTLDPKRILTGLDASTRHAALTAICEALFREDVPLCRTAVSALLAREDVGSTGIGNGIAIPHAKLTGMDAPLVGIAALKHPVDFGAPDGMPVDLLFVVLMPDATDHEVLPLLARIVKVLRGSGIAERIRQQTDPEALARVLLEAEQHFLHAQQGKS
jgi:nitrogen PTS system EIIA component